MNTAVLQLKETETADDFLSLLFFLEKNSFPWMCSVLLHLFLCAFFLYIYFLVVTFMTWRLVISQIFLRESFFAGVYFPPLKKALPYCCQKIEQNSNNFFLPGYRRRIFLSWSKTEQSFWGSKNFSTFTWRDRKNKTSLALIFSRFRIFANVFIKVSQKMQCSSRKVKQEVKGYFHNNQFFKHRITKNRNSKL